MSRLEYQVAGKLLEYVHQTQLRELSHLKRVHHYEIKDFLQMNYATMTSLDLTENARTGKKHGSLYWLMDETKTAMGMRLLRRWIQHPLLDKERILKRQDVVQVFLDHFFERSDLTDSLKGVYDIDRLASRVYFGKTNPKDLLQLAATLSNVPQIKGILQGIDHPVLGQLIENLDDIPELANLIQSAISPDAPNVITEGNIIQTGFDETLDKYRVVLRDGTSWIADIEAKERVASGINNLKIDYNKKDGYYFHVTNSQLEHVPSHFFRKATLKNSERFGTEELARIEGEMLEAREKSANLEYEIFIRMREEAGKSTYMRQLAIIVIMAQMGSYVSAERAQLPIFDAIFTRIGAADDLVSGQSTFMVEMMEANHAISQATEHSLILFDELGRGTATYDGMALAQAIIEYIHNRTGAKTLFATHYHELTDLSTSLTQLENVHVATLEKDGQVTFLHKIEAGPADKSYGIHVARIAGLPNDLLMRADQILARLEEQANEKPSLNPSNKGANDSKENQVSEQISLFTETTESPILDELRQLDIYNMTPMEVMLAIAEMKKHL